MENERLQESGLHLDIRAVIINLCLSVVLMKMKARRREQGRIMCREIEFHLFGGHLLTFPFFPGNETNQSSCVFFLCDPPPPSAQPTNTHLSSTDTDNLLTSAVSVNILSTSVIYFIEPCFNDYYFFFNNNCPC